jgi:hypothetical protein
MSQVTRKATDAAVSVAGCLLYLVFVSALIALGMVFFAGAVWVSAKVLPWLFLASFIVIAASLFIFLPLAIFPRCRPVSGTAFYVASYVIGLTLWAWSLLLVLSEWGVFWAIVGLCFAGVGVVPMALLMVLFEGEWSVLLQLIIGCALTYGIRFGGIALTTRPSLPAHFDSPPAPPTFDKAETVGDKYDEPFFVLDDGPFLPLCRVYAYEVEDDAGAEEQIDIGLNASDEGDLPATLAAFKKAVELDPYSPWARYNYGVVLSFADRHADALTQYRDLKPLDPGLAKKLYEYVAENIR